MPFTWFTKPSRWTLDPFLVTLLFKHQFICVFHTLSLKRGHLVRLLSKAVSFFHFSLVNEYFSVFVTSLRKVLLCPEVVPSLKQFKNQWVRGKLYSTDQQSSLLLSQKNHLDFYHFIRSPPRVVQYCLLLINTHCLHYHWYYSLYFHCKLFFHQKFLFCYKCISEIFIP